MFMKMIKVIIFGTLLNVISGNLNNLISCSTRCPLTSDTINCWKRTLRYKDWQLANELNKWFVVKVNLDKWYYNQSQANNFQRIIIPKTTLINNFAEDLYKLPSWKPKKKYNQVFRKLTFKKVATSLLNTTTYLSKSLKTFLPMPLINLPCQSSKKPLVAKYIFLGSFSLNVLFLLMVMVKVTQTLGICRMSTKKNTKKCSSTDETMIPMVSINRGT